MLTIKLRNYYFNHNTRVLHATLNLTSSRYGPWTASY